MKFPVLRYVIAYILGILLYEYHPEVGELINIEFIFYLIIFLYLFILVLKIPHKNLWLGILAIFFIGLMGFHFSDIRDYSSKAGFYKNENFTKIRAVQGIVLDGPTDTKNTVRYIIEMSAVHANDTVVNNSTKFILYLKRAESTPDFKYGDEVIIKGIPQKIQSAKSPGAFDYALYMSRKGVYHQVFAKPDDVNLISSGNGLKLKEIAFSLKQKGMEILQRNITDSASFAIAGALIFGEKSELNEDLKNAFANAGAIHVLAVSGLHVGIIYQILILILGFLNKIPKGKYLLFFISTALLFMYALITGFSPSVNRAVLMFSLFALANLIDRKSNIYNTLAIAAFILLFIDPKLLFDLGFQLSFLAVGGIVYFYPLLTRDVEISNTILDKMYKLSCVSIGAQITTLPLTLLYFHQFPNYFLLSNFLVIPLAGILLSLGMVLLAISYFDFLEKIIGFNLNLLLEILNKGVTILSDLPFSVTKNIQFDLFQSTMLFVMIFCVVLIIEFRKKQYLYSFSVILILFSLYLWTKTDLISKQNDIVVFGAKEDTYFTTVNANHLMMNAQPDSIEKEDFWKYSLSAFALKKGAKKFSIYPNHMDYKGANGDFLFFKDNIVIQPNSEGITFPEFDWILIDSKNASVMGITDYNPRKGFILANNIPFFIKSELIKKLKIKKASFHDLKENGALELTAYGDN